MKRSLLFVLCVAASVAACSDNLATTPNPAGIITPTVPAQSLVGTVEVAGGKVWLRLEATNIRLDGVEAGALRGLAGSEVEVRGTMDGADDGFIVAAFSVRAVDGLPAADGFLEATDDGYALRLADNTLRLIMDPPAELMDLVGQRVWIAGPVDAPPVEFGVISYT